MSTDGLTIAGEGKRTGRDPARPKRDYIGMFRNVAVQGAIWALINFGLQNVIRLGSNLILTRLLYPELFGLMMLVQTIFTGMVLLTDVGLSTSVVRHERGDDDEFLNTVWTMQIIRGFGLWMFMFVLAFPLGAYYNEPRLTWLLPVAGATHLLGGFYSTSILTLSRNIDIRRSTLFELAGQLISLTVMISWAWVSPGILALVAGNYAAAIFTLCWSHLIKTGKPNRIAWNKEVADDVLSFGKWIVFSSTMTFLSGQADRLMLGKVFSFEFLGVYSIGFMLATMPLSIVTSLTGRVVFPSISRLVNLPRHELHKKIEFGRKYLLFSFAVLLGCCAGLGDLVVKLLYDKRYEEAAWILPLIAAGTWPTILAHTISPAVYALGRPRLVALGSMASFISVVAGILIGSHFFGPFGAVMGIAVSTVPAYLITSVAVWKEDVSCFKQDVMATIVFWGVVLVLVTARWEFGL